MARMFAALLLLVSGRIQSEVNDPLPNGYRFVELSKGNGAIVTDEGEFAVYPNVVEYQLNGALVTGRRVLATDNTDYSQPFTEGLGNFVFDTGTGELKQGVSEMKVE